MPLHFRAHMLGCSLIFIYWPISKRDLTKRQKYNFALDTVGEIINIIATLTIKQIIEIFLFFWPVGRNIVNRQDPSYREMYDT